MLPVFWLVIMRCFNFLYRVTLTTQRTGIIDSGQTRFDIVSIKAVSGSQHYFRQPHPRSRH
jgi:hypothetical protein